MRNCALWRVHHTAAIPQLCVTYRSRSSVLSPSIYHKLITQQRPPPWICSLFPINIIYWCYAGTLTTKQSNDRPPLNGGPFGRLGEKLGRRGIRGYADVRQSFRQSFDPVLEFSPQIVVSNFIVAKIVRADKSSQNKLVLIEFLLTCQFLAILL